MDKKIVITNAFSVGMVLLSDTDPQATLKVRYLSLCQAQELLKHHPWRSALTQGRATIVGRLLGVDVTPDEDPVPVDGETVLLIPQYIGPKFPEEEAMELPYGGRIEFYTVESPALLCLIED